MYIWIPNSITWTHSREFLSDSNKDCAYSLYPSLEQNLMTFSNTGRIHSVCHTCVCVCVWMSCAVVSDSCDLMNCSPPGFFVHGISQARILEWVSIPFSRGSSQPRDWTWVSCIAGRFFIIWATRQEVCHPCQNLIRKSLILFPPKNGRKEKTIQDFLTWEYFPKLVVLLPFQDIS